MSEKQKLSMSLDEVIKMSKKRPGSSSDRPNKDIKGGRRANIRGGQKGGKFFRNKNRSSGNRGNFRNKPAFRRRKPSFENKPNQRPNQRRNLNDSKRKFIKKTGKGNTRAEPRPIQRETSNDKRTVLRISGLHLNIVNSELYV